MFVKDLIKDTLWTSSENYGLIKPKLSVLLPTYSRGQSGLFERAIHSILQQTFSDFELIIIDDASTDGTKFLIEQFMAQDKRISCLTHRHNIGLPAVSEYEAFIRSTGDYIIFAFDDFVFEPNAFMDLYQFAIQKNASMCYGFANVYYNDHLEQRFILFDTQNLSNLETTNCIANSSVIIKKEVFYKVGLYDPHILLARTCDWDLWRRISKHYTIYNIPILIGSEFGNTTKDSLGALYHHPLSIVRLYTATHRDQQLLPQHFQDINVLKPIKALSDKCNLYIQQLSEFFSNKRWYKESNLSLKPPQYVKKIIFYCNDLVNYYLCFHGLNHDNNDYIIVPLMIGGYHDLYPLLDADLVIFNRFSSAYSPVVYFLNLIKIPCYQFIDDNFFVLDEQYKIPTLHTTDKMIDFSKKMNGILTSSSALQSYYIQQNIHSNVACYPPILDKKLLAILPPKQGINIVILGDLFRWNTISESIFAALNQIHQEQPVTLIIKKGIISEINKTTFPIIEFEFQENYYQLIHMLRDLNITLVIHPSGLTQNLPYKTRSILLSALYLQANIIVFDDPVFSELGLKEGVIKSQANIPDIITSIFHGVHEKQGPIIQKNLYEFCSKHFNSDNNISILNMITKTYPPLNSVRLEERSRLLHYYMSQHIQLPNSNSTSNKTSPKTNKIYNLKYRINQLISQKDLTPHLSSNFIAMLISRPTLKHILRTSPLLNNKSYIEYLHYNSSPQISKIFIACENNQETNGFLGVEIIANGIRVAHSTRPIASINFFQPICFEFTPVMLDSYSYITIRIFARNIDLPMFTYEFRKKYNSLSKQKHLFCSVE